MSTESRSECGQAASLLRGPKLLYGDPVSTGMGDCLTISVCNHSQLGQLSHATLRGRSSRTVRASVVTRRRAVASRTCPASATTCPATATSARSAVVGRAAQRRAASAGRRPTTAAGAPRCRPGPRRCGRRAAPPPAAGTAARGGAAAASRTTPPTNDSTRPADALAPASDSRTRNRITIR